MASTVAERQVLPRHTDHGNSLFAAGLLPYDTDVLILDFANAFMSIPLDERERHLNCSVVPGGIRRSRPPLHAGEPMIGKLLVWNVLGFGGHSYPLVYSRVATFAARSGQSLLMAHPDHDVLAQGRIQLYVDDPIVTITGSTSQRRLAVDVLLLWWLCLGVPLAWKKGSVSPASHPHTWIGVTYEQQADGSVFVMLPRAFLEELRSLLVRFAQGSGTSPIKQARSLCGKVARMAQILPNTQPYATALYGAFLGATTSATSSSREAPPSRVAHRRFVAPARALAYIVDTALTSDPDRQRLWGACLHLRHSIPKADVHHQRVHVDASIWGGGAVLYEDDIPTAWMQVEWSEADLYPGCQVKTNESKHLPFWEFLMFFLALERWGACGLNLAILGDNIGSLQNALAKKGCGASLRLAAELAWRQCCFSWEFTVGHLPSEHNKWADALSRLQQPQEPAEFPEGLRQVTRDHPMPISKIWVLQSFEPS